MSDSTEDEKKKRKQNPFDFLSDKDLQRIFDEMKEYIESDSFKEMVEDIIDHSYYEKKAMDSLFDIDENDSFHLYDDDEFDNVFLDDQSYQQKPTADIMKDETHVMVTIYLPSIKRKHITLFATESDIEVVVDHDESTLYDIIDLPALVNPTTAVSTFNNGVLDILIERKEYLPMGVEIDIQ